MFLSTWVPLSALDPPHHLLLPKSHQCAHVVVVDGGMNNAHSSAMCMVLRTSKWTRIMPCMAYTTLLPDLGPCAPPSHKQRFFRGPPSENHTLQCALESHHVFAVVDIHFAQRPQRIFQLLLTTGHLSNPRSCIQVLLENCTFVHSAQSCNLCFQFLTTSTSLLVETSTSDQLIPQRRFCVHAPLTKQNIECAACLDEENLVDLPLHDAWRWLRPDSSHQHDVMFRRQPLPKHLFRVQVRSFLCIFNE